jgi:CheY-like chemotaxis protein
MHMKSILFVDDSEYVLQSIERMLQSMRGDWEMKFACSGEAALALLQERAFDVVVADLKMPGTSGTEVLKTVKELHPAAACFILSGEADSQDVKKRIAAGCRLLEKPCTADTLRTALAQATV